MRSTALPAVSLIPRWLVPSYTLPRVLATTWFIQQVFSLHPHLSHFRWRLRKADHPYDMERKTGHRPRPCSVTQPPSSAHGGHYSYLRLAPLSLDVSFLPQLLSLLPRFNRPTKLYDHQYIRRQPPDHGRVQWHAPVVVGAAENYARPVDVASLRVVQGRTGAHCLPRFRPSSAAAPLPVLTPCKTSPVKRQSCYEQVGNASISTCSSCSIIPL
jgi:hypothetical protein